MFINRPLIHGVVNNNNMTTKKSLSIKDSIRVKTIPSQSLRKSMLISRNNKHLTANKYGDSLSMIDNNLIGIKDVKEMMDCEIEGLLQKINQFQSQTKNEQQQVTKKYIKKQKQLTKSTNKNTILSNNNNTKLSQNELHLEQQQQRAYIECKQMLQMRNQQQQKVFSKINDSIVIKIYQLQQGRLQFQAIIKQIQQQSQNIKNEILKRQQQLKLYKKRQITKQKLKQQIQQQLNNIQTMSQQLYNSKQQSIKQKNDFIQIQAEEIKLIKQIQQKDQQQQKQFDNNQQYQYYRKIQKLRDKLLKSKNKQIKQMDEYFDQKINDVINVRVGNDKLQSQTVQLQSKIEEQLAIIQMLQKRNHQLQKREQPNQQQSNLSKMYRHKYQRLFMNKYNKNNKYHHQLNNNNNRSSQQSYYQSQSNNHDQEVNSNKNRRQNNNQIEQSYRELNHWQNYKSYLQKILMNQKKLINKNNNRILSNNDSISPSFVNSTKQNSQLQLHNILGENNYYNDGRDIGAMNRYKKSSNINSRNSQSNQNQFRSKYKQKSKSQHASIKNSTIINTNNNDTNSHNHNNQQSILKPRSSLPRLVKMQGNIKDKDKIKNQLTKFANQHYDQNIQLQTVRTSQADQEQDLIQVEFKANTTNNFINKNNISEKEKY